MPGIPPPPFECTSAWCYRFSRYTAIPDILELPEVSGGQPFRLVELSKRLLDRYVSPDQQVQTYLRAEAGQPLSIRASVKYYIRFIAINTGQLVRLGDGLFRLPSPDDIDEQEIEDEALDDAADDQTEEVNEVNGWIYAFTFPLIRNAAGPYPIKVGKTSGDVERRVALQCRQSAAFDNPVIVGRWKVSRVSSVEKAIHNVLNARGKWRENVPGTEWFNTTPEEIDVIVGFVTEGTAT